ncbi:MULTISPECIES: hypothetical protein [Burkholderiaceae]|nr:hypothetical protein [Burkholderia sp. b14]
MNPLAFTMLQSVCGALDKVMRLVSCKALEHVFVEHDYPLRPSTSCSTWRRCASSNHRAATSLPLALYTVRRLESV